MFINQLIIAVIFRLINFGILIGLAACFFRKYGLPVVDIMIAQKDAEKELLLSRQLLLEQKQAELDSLIKQDVILCESFKRKISQWRDVVAQERSVHEKDRFKRNEILAIKKRKKAELLSQAYLQKTVAASVLAGLQKSLTDRFEKEDAGEAYLDSMMQAINERAS
jgi:hypothetical protein